MRIVRSGGAAAQTRTLCVIFVNITSGSPLRRTVVVTPTYAPTGALILAARGTSAPEAVVVPCTSRVGAGFSTGLPTSISL